MALEERDGDGRKELGLEGEEDEEGDRINSSESVMAKQLSNYFPLYFIVKQAYAVMATEQPCDLAYEFGDEVLDLVEHP
ncbi:hypothetical protein LguiB_027303 [Lonicera macranthoides]